MTILDIPPWFDLNGFCQQFNIDQSQVVLLEPGRIQLPVVWPQTIEDTLCSFFNPPSTVEERLEAAELFLGLLLDQEVTQ